MKKITKTFPGVTALSDVDFDLRRGEVHALMGENGAGKSTLIKVLTGVERQDAGQIELEGKPVLAKNPHHAQELGISTVYQEINLCPNLSVAENIFIGREPSRFGAIKWRMVNARAEQALDRLDVRVDVTQSLGSYSVAIQQMVAIARALDISARVLVLDEPTSSLAANEVEKLFQVMRKLKEEGLGIVFITHFLDQTYEISDSITVLRHGELVGCYETALLPRLELVSKIIGKELDNLDDVSQLRNSSAKHVSTETLVQARGLGRKGSVKPFDLDLNAGEVLGFAGLLGSGRTEAARLLFGIDSPDSGTLMINGEEVRRFSPLQFIRRGVGLCPEDRNEDGLVDDLTVRENIVLALQSSRGWLRHIPRRQQYEIADKYIEALDIVTPSADQIVKNLSGGNKQKVILARWLATDPRVLILDEPTRGIDIGTKTEIQKLVISLAEEGKVIVFISSELDEVIRCSHRVKVLREREVVTELVGDEVEEGRIMRAIAGGWEQ
jgi:simple sugar transport system ATP-binding protein